MIIKSKTFAVNFNHVQQNKSGLFYKDAIYQAIAQQEPELALLLHKLNDTWLSKETIQELVRVKDYQYEKQCQLKFNLETKQRNEEDMKLYASFTVDFKKRIDLGISNQAYFKELPFNELIKQLQARTIGNTTNVNDKNVAHEAIYKLSLQKQPTVYVYNELGLKNVN